MKNIVLLLLGLLVLLAVGCASSVTVSQINGNPDGFLGKEVVVSGKVIIPISFGDVSGFTLKEGDSSVMVTSGTLPEDGADVVVKGVLVKAPFTGQLYIYAKEIH
jgi:hypothetical protein